MADLDQSPAVPYVYEAVGPTIGWTKFYNPSLSGGGGGGGSPGGTNGQVQFNNAGAFGGYTNAQLTALIIGFSSGLSGAVPASGGGTTNFLRADGTWAVPSGTGPGGSTGQVQWNNGGAFGGFTLGGDATLVASTGIMTIANQAVTYAKMQNISGASLLLGRGSAAGGGSPQEITLGTNLTMSGTTLNATGGGGTPGGSTTQVQFNDGGAFGGDTGLTWDKTNNALAINFPGAIGSTGTFGTPQLSIAADGTAPARAVRLAGFGTSGLGTTIAGSYTRNANPDTQTTLTAGDQIISTEAWGSNGTSFIRAGQDAWSVDGTPTGSAVPARYTISSNNASGTLVERLRVDANGLVNIGNNGAAYQVDLTNYQLQLSQSGGTSQGGLNMSSWVAGSASYDIAFAHSRSATQGTQTALTSGDRMGRFLYYGSDGTAFVRSAIQSVEVDGTVATGIVPSRFVWTTMPVAGSLVERLRIDNAGNIVLDASTAAQIATNSTDKFLHLTSMAGVPSGTPTAYTGKVPIVVDTTDSRLYGFFGAAWVNLTGAGGGGTPGGANLSVQYNNGGAFGGFGIYTAASHNLQLDAADAAAPNAQTIQVQSVSTGTSNTAGANWTFIGSKGTGTGSGGSIIFQSAPAGTTGTSQNAAVNVLQVATTFTSQAGAPGVQIGSGTTTSAGAVIGTMQTGFGAIWGTGVTPSTVNWNYAIDQSGNLCILNGGTQIIMRIANVPKFSVIGSSTTVQIGDNAYSFGWSDTLLTRPAAATLQHGAADAAAPVAQTVQVQSVVAGTSNVAGALWSFNGSKGTGTGAGGDIAFFTAPAGTTGTSQNAVAEVIRVLALGNIKFTNAANFSANGAVATTLGSVGPTGASTTVTKWLTLVDNGGVTRYIPCF